MKMINKCMRKVLSIDYKQLEFNLKCADTVVIRVINSKITKSKIKSCSNKLGRAPESAYAFGVGCYVSSPLPNRHTPLGMRAKHFACPERRMPIRGPLTQIVGIMPTYQIPFLYIFSDNSNYQPSRMAPNKAVLQSK
jgi:hypothetical protein